MWRMECSRDCWSRSALQWNPGDRSSKFQSTLCQQRIVQTVDWGVYPAWWRSAPKGWDCCSLSVASDSLLTPTLRTCTFGVSQRINVQPDNLNSSRLEKQKPEEWTIFFSLPPNTDPGEEVLYLGKSGPLPFRLDGDGVGSPLQNLVYVLFAELGAFIFLIH